MYSMSMSVSVGMFISSPSMAYSPGSDLPSHFVFAIRLPEAAGCKWMK